MENILSRRNFIGGSAACLVEIASPAIAKQRTKGSVGLDRLWIMRVETGEQINHPFVFRDEAKHRKAWASYSYFWRDIKDGGQAVWMDPRLLVLLAQLQVRISNLRGEETILHLNSGYRTPERNATLEGAAKHSLHCRGCAADFWSPDVTHRAMRKLASQIPQVGGVGGYSGFTHVDTGPQRAWGLKSG